MKIALRYKKLPFSTKKSGASDSAFSLFNPRYCSLVSKGKVWIKVCNMKSQKATGRLHLRAQKRNRRSLVLTSLAAPLFATLQQNAPYPLDP